MKPVRTGKTRYRVLHRLFRPDVLVLQYEVESPLPMGYGLDTTHWEDARPEWLLENDTGGVE